LITPVAPEPPGAAAVDDALVGEGWGGAADAAGGEVRDVDGEAAGGALPELLQAAVTRTPATTRLGAQKRWERMLRLPGYQFFC
jgi:hypothetical protein